MARGQRAEWFTEHDGLSPSRPLRQLLARGSKSATRGNVAQSD
jgi:hypothetical protein